MILKINYIKFKTRIENHEYDIHFLRYNRSPSASRIETEEQSNFSLLKFKLKVNKSIQIQKSDIKGNDCDNFYKSVLRKHIQNFNTIGKI